MTQQTKTKARFQFPSLKTIRENLAEPNQRSDEIMEEGFKLAWNVAVYITIMTSSILMGIFAYLVLASPDGLVGTIAATFANTCTAYGYCNLDQLMGGLGMMTVVIIGMFFLGNLAFKSLGGFFSTDETDREYMEDQFAILNATIDDIQSQLQRQLDYEDAITEALRPPTDAEIEEGV